MIHSRIGSGYGSYSRLASRNNEPQTGIVASLRQKAKEVNASTSSANSGNQSDSVTISNAAREALMAARMNTVGQSTAGAKDPIEKWRPKEENIDDKSNSASANPAKLNEWARKMSLISTYAKG